MVNEGARKGRLMPRGLDSSRWANEMPFTAMNRLGGRVSSLGLPQS